MLPGISIGIPLNIYQGLYTNLHYGFNMIDSKDVVLQCALGYYIYGCDRYNDYKEDSIVPYNKKELYEQIKQNESLIVNSLHLSLFVSLFILLKQDLILDLPFVGLLGLCSQYKYWKTYVSIYKPFVISILWASSCVILPCVLHDHNYDILHYPRDYLPCALTLCSASNYIDIKDIDDDINNHIQTFPVLYGKQTTMYLSLFLLLMSSILLENKNNVSYGLLEIQNVILAYWMVKNNQ
jgi:4-hydroxybenzoate polyprenyltransferase